MDDLEEHHNIEIKKKIIDVIIMITIYNSFIHFF
jgi:hypothetical protein